MTGIGRLGLTSVAIVFAACVHDAPVKDTRDCRAHRSGGIERPCVDVAFVLDVSRSTIDPASRMDRADLLRLGQRKGTPPGSKIEGELVAVRSALARLDPDRAAVAIISFSGTIATSFGGLLAKVDPATGMTELKGPAARTELGLTNDFAPARSALDRIAKRGANGETDSAAGVEQAASELGRRNPANSSEGHIIVVTDGPPTLPYAPGQDSTRKNMEAFARAIDRAVGSGLAVHVIGLVIYDDEDWGRLERAAPAATFTTTRTPEELQRALAALVDSLLGPSSARSP